MRINNFKALLKAALRVVCILPLAAGVAFGQQVVNLTAGPTSVTLPDGSTVPMWGYSCGLPVTTNAAPTATCAALNPHAPAATATTPAGWSPVVITVPTGQALTINLTNNLTFQPPTPTGGTAPVANTVPTSLMIVGQLGGGLGGAPTTTTSPTHPSQVVTWSTVGSAPAFTPPPQGARVQSFGTEVAAAGSTLGTGQVASGSALTWTAPRPGTYLLESGTHPSIQGPMGLIGMLVVTTAPAGTAAGTAYPGSAAGVTPVVPAVTYNADIDLLLSEIDPVQNRAVNTAVNTAGFGETNVWSGQPGQCGNPGSPVGVVNTCYPPAVNYTPLYYLFNGVAFSKTNAPASLFPTSLGTTAAPVTGTVLVRLVNAGLRMHVPSIIGSQTGTAVSPATPPSGFSIIAEDGNLLPGIPRVQSEVFMPAGKTNDVMINVPAAGGTALPVFDRELSLSGNAIGRDTGMLAYIGANGAGLPAAVAIGGAVARNDPYPSLVAGQTFTVSDPSKGVIANDTNVYGVQLLAAPTNGTVTLNANGTFTYVPTGTATSDSFTYCANGAVTGTACSSGVFATVNLTAAAIGTAPSAGNTTYNANVAGYLAIKTPGVLSFDSDPSGYPLQVAVSTVAPASGLSVNMSPDGAFTATLATPNTVATTATFTYQAQNSQGTFSNTATVTINFPVPSNLQVTVVDGVTKIPLPQVAGANGVLTQDFRWIIEEDRSYYVDPNSTTNTTTGTTGPTAAPTYGVNFHTSNMPYVAQGCTGPNSCESGQTMLDTGTPCGATPGVPAGCSPTAGTHQPAVCDVGDGSCRIVAAGIAKTAVLPSQVSLDPSKRYYISVLPGDAADPFYAAGPVGHGMGGAPIPFACTLVPPATTCTGTFAAVTVYSEPSPYPPGKLSVFVYQDDFPLNGEHDGGGGGVGGIDTTIASNEQGLGQFQIHLWDAFGGNGDFTGQMSYDMFNQPLSNSLAGTIDPATGFDACPISTNPRNATDPTSTGITGMIVTCPTFESDKKTFSPLAGQAVVPNLMPGRWGVIASPGADRIARGEEWLQTNTLDGQKAHDVFTRISEPNFFQEYGPSGFHVSIGFANPKIINSRLAGICAGTDPNLPGVGGTGHCNNTIKGTITGERLSRPPDERIYGSSSRDAFAWTQCFVSVGDPDGEDFAFTKCAADGTFTLTGIPDGDWRITTFDQWNDQLVDGLSTPVRLGNTTPPFCPGTGSSATLCNMGDIAATQWQTNVNIRTFMDENKDGIANKDAAGNYTEGGIPLLNVAVRLRDGSLANLLATDFNGTTNFNETFPLFSWYTVETDVTRYKNTGTHVVYDAGGPADGSTSCGVSGYPPCGSSVIGHTLANTVEQVSLPTNLRVPGAIYCANADCNGYSMLNHTASAGPSSCSTSATGVVTCTNTLSTGRIDPPWVGVEGWQGFPGQNSFIEFGKEPYAAGENGGIKGHVVYASTRPFDDPYLLVQTQWTPLVPNVTINLYQEGVAADKITPTLTLVDHTKTSSWDDFAQGFRADGVTPNMNCPGQSTADLFYFTLYNQPNYLNTYNAQHTPGGTVTPLPNNSQFKCYDGMHNWTQVQPAPYDGMYKFPSVTATDANGKPTLAGTNCTICTANTAVPASDLYYGIPQLPTAGQLNKDGTVASGKYVVEVVLPPGFELVKEEDKNILIGDNFIAPVTQQFGGLGNVFILPDQASVASAYNANNPQNPTQSFGASPLNGIVPSNVPEPLWPCVGQTRIVPDHISLYPQTGQVAPFAGATRNLCDRKEVTLGDQTGAIAKFFVYTSTHIASKFTGGITDDFTSEFDPFSPQFGEKFAPPDLPVSFKDWTGTEISRVYADHWGAYNGMTYSTWEVNPPNPTGYAPTMMIVCMNDPGPIIDTRTTIVDSTGATISNPTFGKMITDPLFNPSYSQFCYELPFMPGTTQYLDTPVVPTSAFAGAGYNNVDCAYPTLTPAIKEVDGNQVGPYVSAAGQALRITALGDQYVNNYAYSGPSATAAPYNQKTVLRHYGFGSTAGTVALVGSDGVPHPLSNVTWSDSTITGNAPSGLPNCAVQQQAQYTPTGTTAAKCGELVITTANTAAAGQPSNAKQSIDTVTVTIGGKQPKHILASDSIQSAIDAASPGDLLMVDPTCAVPTAATTPVACSTAGATTHTNSSHNEILLMWKPVRLQGVGAASSILDGNAHPAGKLDPWRRQVNCLFGLSISGYPLVRPTGTTVYDPSGTYFCDPTMQFSVDRLPLEAVIGWDASQNGNLAEQLQEPSLMGALEGAAITVLSKGVIFPPNSDPFGVGAATPGAFPTGTTLLQNVTGVSTDHCNITPNPYPSNFMCNPSSIDGLGITDSSQGGGAIFVHGWGHNIQIANNRIYNNAGTLSGGINIGQGEFPPSYSIGGLNAAPGSCLTPADAGTYSGEQLPYCHELNVNVHHNNVSANLSTGDELFSVTPAGSGGASICTGSDYYKFNYNWICGNLSTGDGGGVGHIGYSWNGDMEHNTIIFNQSTNPTIPTNGGGILVMGAPDIDPTCGITTDADCLPAIPNAPSDGAGPGLVINANLIMGNAAESGSGGGLRFQGVNGTDVITFPSRPDRWYSVKVTNNIIANNVAGWDGAGISLVDALAVNIVNNTIVSNDTTASSGVLFNTLGAPLASSQGPCPYGTGTTFPPATCVSGSSAQPAGLVAIGNTPQLTTGINGLPNLAGGGKVICPTGHPNCAQVSYPVLDNDVFYQNRTFHIGVGALSTQYQQNIVTLYTGFGNTNTPVATQSTTGACSAVSYWDIGVRGDSGPGNHNGGPALAPTYSVLTNASENGAGTNNLNSSPSFVSQYCNGSRTIPELKSAGWQVPPGISDATVPNPIFNLTPTATVDEGNNWINIQWGPLTMSNPTAAGPLVNSPPLGNYALAAGSPAIDYIPNTSSTYALAPSTDFFGNRRPDPANPNHIDVGAVEFQGGATTVAIASVTGGPLAFGNVALGTSSAARTLTLHNTGGAALTGIATTFSSARYAQPAGAAGGTCGNALPPNSTCTINVVFSPTALGAVTPAGTVTIAASVAVTGSPVALTGTGVAGAPAATLTPTSHAFGNAARGVILGPVQIFTLTNTGSVPLTGITQAALGGTNATEFTIVRLLSTCGPAGGGQLLGQTTLAPGAACVFTVMFKPLTTQPIGAQTATVSVTDLAGTQTSTPLTGTAQ